MSYKHTILKKRWVFNTLECLIIVTVLISSSTIWVQEDFNLINISFVRIISLFCTLLWALLCTSDWHVIISKKDLQIFIFVIVLMILYFLFHPNWILSPIVVAFTPMLVFLFAMFQAGFSGRINEFARKYVIIMSVLACESLFFYVLVNLHLIHPTGYISNLEWSWVKRIPSYFNLYYDPMPASLFGFKVSRNCAIFPEAPMYCYPLCIAMTINDVLLEPSNRKISVLFAVTIITTLSTTGYLFLAMLYGYKIWKASEKGYKKSKFLVLPILLFFGAVIVINLFEKKMMTSSYSIRLDHVLASFKCFFETHLLGCGIGNVDYVQRFMIHKQGIACGLPYMLAQGGIFWGLIFFVPFLCFIPQYLRRNNQNSIVAFLLFSYLLFVTACHNKYITWLSYAIILLFNNYNESMNCNVKKLGN